MKGERKRALASVLTLFLASMSAMAFNVQPVKASGTIYINADGSVSPSTAPIQRNGDVYTLTGSITFYLGFRSDSSGIVIERDDMMLDGAGYTVDGQGPDYNSDFYNYGINLTGTTGAIVKNTKITGFGFGIYLASSAYGTAFDNSINGNTLTGNGVAIYLSYSSNNRISGNTIANNGGGIYLYSDPLYSSFSEDNTIFGNDIANNKNDGIHLYYSSFNSISDNNLTANGGGIYIGSAPPSSYSFENRIYHNNLVNNTYQAFGGNSSNHWDDGYPSGGNYWSDYTGTDTNGDGIGDIPYIIDAKNRDNYPLMKPFGQVSEFDPVRDSFTFLNKGFGGFGLSENVMSFSDVANFIMTDPVYKSIEAALPGSTLLLVPMAYNYLVDYQEQILDGHCFGMSYLVARWFSHPTERPGYPDSTVQSLQLNFELHGIIDYAQQSRLLDFYTFVRWYFVTRDWISWSNLKEYQAIKNIVQTGTPAVMGMADNYNEQYHAVVVYRIQSSGSIDTLLIADPNNKTDTYSFDTTKDDLGLNFRILAMGITDRDLFDAFLGLLSDSLTLWVHCPAQLHVYDSAGRHAGLNATGKFESGFQSIFFQTNDSQLIFIPHPSGEYNVKLIGTGSGAYNLTAYRALVNKVVSTNMTRTIESNQIAEYTLTQNGENLTMQYVPELGSQWLIIVLLSTAIVVAFHSVSRNKRKNKYSQKTKVLSP